MSSEADSGRDVAIRVRDVSKHYLMFERPEDRFKQMVVPRLQRLLGRPPRHYFRDFAALKDISLEIGRGETVGIIGRNGSGKSTLLQIICGTLQPTSGSVEVNGRIAALLELGAGFNPEFTGRENVFLNASILGVPRQEMEWRFDDIARFADIGIFLDQPVKTYSSGMYVRLAFATAINVDPDILVVDEALAVGDEAFQRKCFARIEDIKDKGGTILFVSHGAQTIVQLCTRAILIDAGEKILEGRPKMVVAQYQRLVNLAGEKAAAVRKEIVEMDKLSPQSEGQKSGTAAQQKNLQDNVSQQSWLDPNLVATSTVQYVTNGARVSDVHITTEDGRPVNVLEIGQPYTLSYLVEFLEDAEQIICGMQAKTISGLALAGANNESKPHAEIRRVEAGDCCRVAFTFVCRFLSGTYLADVGVVATINGESRFAHRVVDALMFRVAPHTGTYNQGYFALDAELKVLRFNDKAALSSKHQSPSNRATVRNIVSGSKL